MEPIHPGLDWCLNHLYPSFLSSLFLFFLSGAFLGGFSLAFIYNGSVSGSGYSPLGNTGITLDTNQDVQFAGDLTSVGGIHIGGTSDPGNDNLIVDGSTTIAGKTTFGDGAKLKSDGAVTTRTDTTAGDGTSAIHSTSTDVAGRITFSNTWANADTCVVAFAAAYTTAPKVILSYNSLVNARVTATTTSGFTITATGTCAGFVDYMVIETV